MRLHRFFITEPLEGTKEIIIRNRELHHQLKDVFRFQVGAKVILLDNSGFEFEAIITSFELNNLHFEIVSAELSKNMPKREITLFASLIKKDNFEWILEKGTEIGVSHFVPVLSERSEKKALNMERAQKIIQEASEQSGRGMLPTLSEPISFEASLTRDIPLIAFDPKGQDFDISKFQNIEIGILIGPEGGWSEREVDMLREKKVSLISLGDQVLRAETAAIVAPSLFLFR